MSHMEQINIFLSVKLGEFAKLRIWDAITRALGWLAIQKRLKKTHSNAPLFLPTPKKPFISSSKA